MFRARINRRPTEGSTMHKILLATAIGAAAFAAVPASANILINGDFETGDYTGWSVTTQGGSNGAIAIAPNNGGPAPISGQGTALNANGGRWYSLTDQGGPGSYSLTQGFTLATASRVTISFDMFANNYAGVVFPGRDYTVVPAQNAVVDILTGAASPFTDAAGDIVSVLYGPGSDAFNVVNPWTSYSYTLNLAAGSYQIRFAETDNQLFFNQGVDNVSIISGVVPEPATWAMLIIGFGAVGFAARRRTAVAA
jgi:hypothetical protein